MHRNVPQKYHLVPGRLRLKIACLKGDEARARLAETQLCQVDGVRNVCANKLTGSLIVRFDPAIVTVAHLFDVLSTHGLLDGRPLPIEVASARSTISSGSFADVLASKAVEAILERCAVALIAAVL